MDGIVEPPIRFSSSPGAVPNGQPLWVDGKSTVSGSHFDLDEFRLTLRAVSDAEIQAWANLDNGSDARVGKGCAPLGLDPLLRSNVAAVGPPKLGNLRYGYEVFGHALSPFALAIGSNRLRLGGLPLPLDLGAVDPTLRGCEWLSSADLLVLGGVLDQAGTATIPLPIANDPGLVGVSLYEQAFLVHPFTAAPMTTNAFVSSLGH